MKRLIAVLMAVAMLLSLLPMTVMADEAEDVSKPVAKLYVGTVNALETPQGDGWSFDAATNTLTLNNCTITDSMVHVQEFVYEDYTEYDRKDAMIYFEGDLTIELIGTNSVERDINEAPTEDTQYFAICAGIYAEDVDGEQWDMPSKLSFTGSGNLTTGIAVSRDSMDEDGWYMNWEYLGYSYAIGCWAEGSADLSGLYGGGWMDIYGGIYGVEAPYKVKAFANSTTFADNCIVTAYRNVEGTIENENGYNWNNNDAWRMYVTTAGAHLSNAGKLVINGDTDASGEGWNWTANVLSLDADTTVQTLAFNQNTSSATLVLTNDLTLDGTLGAYGAPAITAACDLTIDLNGHTLSIPAKDANTAILTEPGSLTILDGQLNISVQPYDPEYAEEMGDEYILGTSGIYANGGGLTLRNVTLDTDHVVIRSSAIDLWVDGSDESIYYDSGPLTVEDSVVSCCELYSESDLSILQSDVTVNGEYSAIRGTTIHMLDSTVSAAVSDSSWGVVLSGITVMDNCNVTLSGAYITWARSADAMTIRNMEITAPADCSFGEGQDEWGDSFYSFWNSDGTLVTALTATASGSEHEHSYENGVCSCGAKQTFTITWGNWDGTVLEVDTVEYGTVPTYDGATPTRPNVGYDFTFYGWALSASGAEVTIGAATQDRTYYAKYTSAIHKHDLIFMDGDLELARKEFDYNKYIYASGLNSYVGNRFEKDCCTHTGWAYADGASVSSFWMPDEDLVIYAVWEGPYHTLVDGICSVCGLTEGMPEHTHFFVEGVCACGKVQTFTVTWTNWDGTVLEVDTVEYGQIPEYNGEIPVKTDVGYDYTFSCWYKGNYPAAFEAVTADLTFKAYYTGVAHKHDLIFMDGDVELARKEFDYNKYIYSSGLNTYAGNPTKACYTLTGWAYADGTAAGAFWMPDEDVVLYAVWDGPNHTWVDATCEAPKTCSSCGVTEGEALEHTYTEGVCSGCGAIQTFTIIWVNWDGTVLEVDTVEYGTVPTYDGATPIRPNVGYDFTFYGWALSASGAETTPGAATQDRTYYAKYTSTVHYHEIIFMDEDMVTELGRYETYYDNLIADSWLTTASGITVPPCYTAWWRYEDGSMPEESFRMPDHDVVLYLMMEGPGHVYDGVVTTEPTCTKEGVMTITCINCGDSYTESLWPKGHSYVGVVTEPTCTEGGYTTHTCTVCGESYVADEVEAHGHDYCNFVQTPPTCTSDGYTTYSCMFCGDSYIADIVEGDHNYVLKEFTPATCTEYGSVTNICTVCGDLHTDENYLLPLGHDYVGKTTTEPTCTSTGVMTYTCPRCSDSYTEEIAKLSHGFDSNAVCSDCGLEAGASVTIGDSVTYYTNAAEASQAIRGRTEDGIVVKMLKDLTVNQEYHVNAVWFFGCKCTFDLNGKTLKGTGNFDAPLTIDKGAYVTVMDSVGTGLITTSKSSAYCIDVNPGNNTDADTPSTAIINSGTFIATAGRAVDTGNLATTIINGGTIHGDTVGVFTAFYDGTLIINGGTITGDRAIGSYGLGDSYTIIIKGGTISGTSMDIYAAASNLRPQDTVYVLTVGEDGFGATFPGGISIGGTSLGKRPLNSLLGEGMTYWVNGNAVSFADDVYEFSGGDVTVRKICEHTYESVVTPPTYNADGYTTHTCSKCGHSYEDTIVPATGFTLAGANTVLGGVLDMNFFIDPADLNGTDYYAVITLYAEDGVVTTTVPYADWEVRTDYLVVTQKGLAARQMADKLEVVIYNDDGTQASFMWTDSIRSYVMRVLDKQKPVAQTMLVDMLNYGAAAQNFFGYNMDDLANCQLSDAQKTYATESVNCINQQVKGENYYGSTLTLKDRILLTVYFSNINPDMYAIVRFTDHKGVAHETCVEGSAFSKYSDNVYGVVVDELVVADGDQLVTVTVYDAEGNVVASGSDNVNSYAARQMGKDALYEMVAKFTTSAYAYFH